MRKVAFICQNPFHTMTAMIMRMQQLGDCVCDAILTDRSSDMERRAELLRETGLFQNVFFLRTSQCWNKGKGFRHHVGQAKCVVCGCGVGELDALSLDYDEIYTLLLNCIVHELVTRMHKSGHDPDIHLVDEGFGCYTNLYKESLFGFHSGRKLFEGVGRVLRNGTDLTSLVKSLYLYRPDLLMWEPPFEVRQILKPDFTAVPELKDMINYVFGYNGEAVAFENKVTFFEGADFQDFGDNRELDLVLDIAQRVGLENLVVKLHPRTQVNRFEKYGITTTDKLKLRQGVPWEVIAMNMSDDANCLFISVNSGAVITYSLLFEKRYHTLLMIKCLEGNGSADDMDKMRFLERYAEAMPEVLAIPVSKEESFEMMKLYM